MLGASPVHKGKGKLIPSEETRGVWPSEVWFKPAMAFESA